MKNKTNMKNKSSMKNKSIQLYATLLVVALLLTSACKKKKPEEDNETEVITTIEITFKDSANAANTKTFIWEDLDGEGGNVPNRIDSIIIDKSKTYITEVKVLDKTKNPVEDITEEVKEEANDHQMYYNLSPATGVALSITDKDGNNLPLGLNTKMVVAATAIGKKTLNVILKHKPGAKAANDAASVGETDVDITFPMRIK